MQLFTPKDESLSERLKALKSVLKANRDIELSIKRMNEKEWSDRLGSPEELKQAQEITTNSLNHAIQSLKTKDLKEAKELGLLTPSETTEIKILMAEAGLTKASSKQQSKAHEKSSYKK